jgi:hypothetical protein
MDPDDAVAVLKKDQGTRLAGEPIAALTELVSKKMATEPA